MKRFLKKGFTLVEVILTLVLLAILASTAIAVFSSYQREAEIESVAEKIVSTLRNAQSKSITGEDTNTWGVHFDTTSENEHFIALFQGSAYGSGTDIEPVYLMHGARLSNLSLNGAGNDVIFNRLTGATSQYGTGAGSRAVCVTNAAAASVCGKGITITANGRISLQ